MCKHHSSSHAHGFHHEDHHHHGHDHHAHDHEHEATQAGGSTLSHKEKLIVRLEHFVRHNSEHAGFLEKLLATVQELGVQGAAEEIRAAADCAVRQSEHLQKALSFMKSD
jgi:hypothetical protein